MSEIEMESAGLPSLGRQLRAAIGAAIQATIAGLDAIDPCLDIPPIPLTLDRRSGQVRYRCAIAQRLAAPLQQAPGEIADQLVAAWNGSAERSALATIAAHPSGSLDLALTDGAIARWLTVLADLEDAPLAETSDRALAIAFEVYYALNRCRSLVASGERQGWFDRHTLAQHWCDTEGQLRLRLAVERQAIVTLVHSTDAIVDTKTTAANPSPELTQKLARQLATQFEQLHRHSRAWEARHDRDTATATARLGLLLSYAHTLQHLV